MSISADTTFSDTALPARQELAIAGWAFTYFLYAIFLHWTYVNVIQSAFYWELKLSPTTVNPAIGALLAALTSLAVPKKFAKPSDLILLFSFTVHIVPAIMVAPHYEAPLAYSLTIAASFIIICTLASFRTVSMNPVAGGSTLFVAFALLCLAITFAAGIQSGRLSPASLSLSSVYEFRTVSAEAVRGGPIQYVTGWTANFLITALFVFALLRKKYMTCAALLGAQLALFMITREKLTIFIPFFGFIAYWAFERGLSPARLFIAICLLIATGVVLAEQYNFELLNFLVIRRVFFAPAALDALYKQVFDAYGLQYWGQFLGRLGGEGGGLPPAVIVGATMANSVGDSSNAGTGYIGSGYMQAGYAGIFAYSFVLGLLLFLANSLAVGRVRNSLATALVFFPFWAAINDSDLPSSFLTQGIFIAMCSLWLIGTAPDWPGHAPRKQARTSNQAAA